MLRVFFHILLTLHAVNRKPPRANSLISRVFLFLGGGGIVMIPRIGKLHINYLLAVC